MDERELTRGDSKRRKEISSFWWVGLVVATVAGWTIWQVPAVQDTWMGWGYELEGKVAETVGGLELTERAERILKASRPAVEESASFNEHCNSHDADISLLGCYTDGKIYVYEVTVEEIAAANKVTMAHELLHAIWDRLGFFEKNEVEGWLEEVYASQREWFDGELETYSDEERLEEIYARAGTKLRDLPEGLERHYAKFFRDRAKIVDYYEEYEAPFLALKMEMETLAETIIRVKMEIDVEKVAYEAEVADLDARIREFNSCLEVAGCITSVEDAWERGTALNQEKEALELTRDRLNEKIMENNERIDSYREMQEKIGQLNRAMNSNLVTVDEV